MRTITGRLVPLTQRSHNFETSIKKNSLTIICRRKRTHYFRAEHRSIRKYKPSSGVHRSKEDQGNPLLTLFLTLFFCRNRLQTEPEIQNDCVIPHQNLTHLLFLDATCGSSRSPPKRPAAYRAGEVYRGSTPNSRRRSGGGVWHLLRRSFQHRIWELA
jgi:hypothetical protein